MKLRLVSDGSARDGTGRVWFRAEDSWYPSARYQVVPFGRAKAVQRFRSTEIVQVMYR